MLDDNVDLSAAELALFWGAVAFVWLAQALVFTALGWWLRGIAAAAMP